MAPQKKAAPVVVRRADLRVVLAAMPLLEAVPTARLYCVTERGDEVMVRASPRGSTQPGFRRTLFRGGTATGAERTDLPAVADVIDSLRALKFGSVVLVNDKENPDKRPTLVLWRAAPAAAEKPKKKAPAAPAAAVPVAPAAVEKPKKKAAAASK